MRITALVMGILLILMGVLSFVFYEQYWAPKRAAEAMLREAIMISERDTPEATNESLKILTSLWARYQDMPIANKALLHIGMAYEKMGLNESALEKFRYLSQNMRGLSGDDRNLLVRRIAHIQILRNYSDEAVSQLYQLLTKSTDGKFRSQIYTELGMLYFKMKKFDKAQNALEIAEREDSSNRYATLEKAKVLRSLGQHDKVFDIYDNFMSYDKKNHPIQSKDVVYSFRTEAFQRGHEEFKKGRYWTAIKYYKIVASRFGGTKEGVKALYWIGEAYFKLGNFKNALAYFSRVKDFSGSDLVDDAIFKMGESFFEMRKFDLAAKEFNDIIIRFPNSNLINLAKEWKEQCENEILHRMKSSQLEGESEKPDLKMDSSKADQGEGDFNPVPKKFNGNSNSNFENLKSSSKVKEKENNEAGFGKSAKGLSEL
jgi:tetratricopeptide (TPR) repeat protein